MGKSLAALKQVELSPTSPERLFPGRPDLRSQENVDEWTSFARQRIEVERPSRSLQGLSGLARRRKKRSPSGCRRSAGQAERSKREGLRFKGISVRRSPAFSLMQDFARSLLEDNAPFYRRTTSLA